MTFDPSRMEVLILAGGRGTRLAGLVDDRPKPMAVIEGRPFLEWLVLYLRSLGFRRIVLCTGHMSEVVERHFGNGASWGVEVHHSREDSPLGTAGALRQALPLTGSSRLFVLNGDSFCPFRPEGLFAAHRPGALATLWLVEVPDGGRFGTVALNKDGTVGAFTEKASGAPTGSGAGLINAGVYLMERTLIERFPKGAFLQLETGVFPLLPRGSVRGAVGRGPFLDIGTPASFAAASAFVRENLLHLAGDRGGAP